MESSISGWAGRLRDFVFTTERAYLFVAKGPAAKVWHFIWQGGSWQKAAESTASGDVVYAAGEQEDGTLLELASQAAMEIAKKGWQDLPVVYVVPEAELIRYALQLPPDSVPRGSERALPSI